jgi:uncharacterized protein
MSNIGFTWDARKARSNWRKHRVSFEEASTVFFDDFAQLMDDPDRSAHEERFILLGRSSEKRMLVVCHCYRGSDEVIRIISARKATYFERAFYPG